MSQFLEFFNGTVDIEVPAFRSGQDQFASDFDRLAADVLFDVFDGDFIDAVFIGLASTAKADRVTGQSLQLDGDVLQSVREIRSASQSLKESASFADAAPMLDHRWQPGHQPFVEAGDLFRGFVFVLAQVNPDFQDLKIRPNVRTTQCLNFSEFHDAYARPHQ